MLECFVFRGFQILFSVIVASAHSKPADYDEDGKLSYGLKYTEQIDADEAAEAAEAAEVADTEVIVDDDGAEEFSHPNYPVSIFTKYPDSPDDDYQPPEAGEFPVSEDRNKRQTQNNEKDFPLDVNQLIANVGSAPNDVKRTERKALQDDKVPLRGLISAIESHLVSTAQEINSKIRKRRAEPTIDADADDSKKNATDDSLDVHKTVFEGLFQYTRPHRSSSEEEAGDEKPKIELHSLVSAVESSLINSAQILKEKPKQKRDTDSDCKDCEDENVHLTEKNAHRVARCTDDQLDNEEPKTSIQVVKLKRGVDLNLLNQITFKPSNEPASEPATTESSSEEVISTTANSSIQRTNLTVVRHRDSVHVILPNDKPNNTHVQREHIETSVFHSSLAIFPTIPPHTINAPLPSTSTTTTTTEGSIESTTSDNRDESLEQQKLIKLKEKIAEIQADPIILSQI